MSLAVLLGAQEHTNVARWVAPREYEVLRVAPVRLAIEPKGSETSIAKVLFYASYLDSQNRFIDKLKIGEVSHFPYEIFWDCAHVPDHAITNLRFYATVVDSMGNTDSVLTLPNGSVSHRWRRFVWCADTALFQDTLYAQDGQRPLTVDGALKDWAGVKGIAFSHGDNQVVVRSAWDQNHLYFGIEVRDTLVMSHYTTDSQRVAKMVEEDDLELFLDLKGERGFFMNRHCPQFVFAPSGMAYQVVRDTVDAGINLRPMIQYKMVIHGHPNDTLADRGYTLECAIPWRTLGLECKPSHPVGFALVQVDNDGLGKTLRAAYWPKLLPCALTMPKKWGLLVFEEKRPWWTYGLIPLLLLTVGLGGYVTFGFRKKKVEGASQKEAVPLKEEIRRAQDYIRLHYMEMELNREKVAQHVGLSPEYFSTLFNKESGTGFSEFVNGLRLAEAERLLKETDIRISEIALEAGFSGLDHFDRTFKKARGLSPKEYRRQFRG